jgi:peptidyl-prolyl cis-trans isomerase-like 4
VRARGARVAVAYASASSQACLNFLKLCKLKYFNNVLFHRVERDFAVQTGDPTGK